MALELNWSLVDIGQPFEDLCNDTIRALLPVESRGTYAASSMAHRRDFACDGMIESGEFKYLGLEAPILFSFKSTDPRKPITAASADLKELIFRDVERLARRNPRCVVFYTNHDLTPSDKERIRARIGGRFEARFQGRADLEACFRERPHLLWKYFRWCPFVKSFLSTDSASLLKGLVPDLLLSDVPLNRVLHPAVAKLSPQSGMRVRLVGKPGAGKSVALWQLLTRMPENNVLVLPRLDDRETWEHLQQLLYQPSPLLTLVIDNLHDSLASSSLLASVVDWTRENGPKVSIVLSYRTTERNKVEDSISTRLWNAWGFTELCLDDPPLDFLKDVVSVTCEALGIKADEEVKKKFAEYVAEGEGTPALAVSALQLYSNTQLSPHGAYPIDVAILERAQEWGAAFSVLLRSGKVSEIAVLRAVSTLYAGGLRPAPKRAVMEVCRTLAGLASGTCDIAMDALTRQGWLNVDEGMVSAHEIQVMPEVTGLISERKATFWLQEFLRLVQADEFPALKEQRTSILLHLADFCEQVGDSERAVALCNAIVEREPSNTLAFRVRGLTKLRSGHVESGFSDLKVALELEDDLLDSWYVLVKAYLRSGFRDEARQLLDRFALKPRNHPREVYFLAKGYREVRDGPLALEWGQRFYEIEPSGLALAMLADATALSGRREEALELLNEGKGKWPDEGAIYAVESDILDGMKRTDEALAAARRAMVLAPNDPSNHAMHAWLLIDSKQPPPEILKAVQDSKKIFPGYPELLVIEGMAYDMLGQSEQAVDCLQRGLRKQDRLGPALIGNAYLALACNLLALGKVGESDEAFTHAQEEGIPEWFCKLREARVIRDALRDDRRAYAAIEQASKSPKATAEVWIELAEMISKVNGDISAARQVLESAASRFPENYRILMQLGEAAYAMGDHQAAAQAFRQASTKRKDNAAPLNRLTNSLFFLGEFEEALPLCQEAVRLEPEEAEHHRALGLCLRYLDRHEEAVAAYDEALSKRPDHGPTIYNKAESLYAMGSWPEALALFEWCSANFPHEATEIEWISIGVCLGQLNRLDEAMQWLEKAATKNPNHGLTHYNLGYVSAQRGLHRQAIECFEKTLAILPDFRQAWRQKARSHMELGEFEVAADTLEKSFICLGNYALGRAYRGGGPDGYLADLVHSAELGDELLEMDSSSTRVRLVLAKAKFALGQLHEVLNLCDWVLNRDPKDLEALTFRARALNRASRPMRSESVEFHKMAEEAARSASSVKPESGAPILQLTVALAGLDKGSEAVKVFQKAKSFSDPTGDDWTMAGCALSWIDADEEALYAFQKALAIEPQSVEALTARAGALRSLGRLDDAIASLDEAIAADPKFVDTLRKKGELLFRKGRMKEAEDVFANALKIDEGDADLHLNYALALREAEEAETHLRRAVEICEKSDKQEADAGTLAVAYRELGLVEGNKGNHEVALDLLSKALHFAPKNSRALDLRAWTLAKLGRREEAKEAFQESLAVEDFPVTRHHFAALLDEMGDSEGAREHRRLAVEWVGESPTGHEPLAELLIKCGLVEGALLHRRKVVELDPTNDSAHRSYANWCSGFGRIEEAEIHYDEAVRINGQSIQNHSDYAAHLLHHGKKEEAVVPWERGWSLWEASSKDDIQLLISLVNTALGTSRIDVLVRALRGGLEAAKDRDKDYHSWLIERSATVRDDLMRTAEDSTTDAATRSALVCSAGVLDHVLGNLPKARLKFKEASLVQGGDRSIEAVLNWGSMLATTAAGETDELQSEIEQAIQILKESISAGLDAEQRDKLERLLTQLVKLAS